MRIFVYASSMRGEYSKSLKIIKDLIVRLEGLCSVEGCYISTPEKDLIEPCSGCMSCLNTGKCVKDKLDHMETLKEEMMASDLIILASPVYLHNVNGPMKNFLDRLNPWCYTMPLLGKIALPVTVSNTNGNYQVDIYLSKILSIFGAGVLGTLSIKNNLMSKKEKDEAIELLCKYIKKYESGQREFFVSEYQLEYYEQMKRMLNNIEKESRLYQIWKKEGMLSASDFQILFSAKRKEKNENEKC